DESSDYSLYAGAHLPLVYFFRLRLPVVALGPATPCDAGTLATKSATIEAKCVPNYKQLILLRVRWHQIPGKCNSACNCTE
ncbi:hypothetical protein ACC810_38685, partial [Rhizobium ruizarguesonis]